MARPHSMDLRERAIARFQASKMVRAVAHALSIGPPCVIKWSRFRATGSVATGTPAASSDRRARRLAPEARRPIGLHVTRACGGACRTQPRCGPSDSLEPRPSRRPVLQKKARCQASRTALTPPASGRAGRRIRNGLIPNASSPSTSLGRRPTWRRRGDRGSTPRSRTATGKP
jgi:hypothetical protein